MAESLNSLVLRGRAGDETAYVELYQRCRKIAFTIGRRYFYKDQTHLLDFVHDGAKEAILSLPPQLPERLLPWMYQVIRQQAQNEIRYRTQAKRAGLACSLDERDEHGREMFVFRDSSPDPERRVIAENESHVLLRCLPRRDRETLIAHYCTEEITYSRAQRKERNHLGHLMYQVREYAAAMHVR